MSLYCTALTVIRLTSFPVIAWQGLNGHLRNSIHSNWNWGLVHELSKSVRWDYAARWWVKLSENKSNSTAGSKPTHSLPILLYRSPVLPGWREMLAELRDYLCMNSNVCICIFSVSECVHVDVCTYLSLWLYGCTESVPRWGRLCECQSGKVSPLMGMTAVQGVVQLVVSESPEKHKSGMCKSVHTSHPSSLWQKPLCFDLCLST